MSDSKLRRLPAAFVEKPWGKQDLGPWFPSQSAVIGEVWFPSELPLLVKFIFTSDRLSVQVHPDDQFAAKHEGSLGKTEMWHILRAEPGAKIALGFRHAITGERLERAAKSGEIVDLLNWVDVSAGDTFVTPAGTVHAIGAGLVLCEIQQNSNVTYRLHDYGSGRELHLEKALQVSHTAALDAKPVALPVECAHFRTESLVLDQAREYQPHGSGFELLIFLAGTGTIAGEPYRLGETWLAPAGCGPFGIEPTTRDIQGATRMLRTWVPARSADS